VNVFTVPQLAQVRGKRCETKCEWVRRVCPIRSRVRTISSLRECKFEKDYGTGVGLIGRSSLWRAPGLARVRVIFLIMNECRDVSSTDIW